MLRLIGALILVLLSAGLASAETLPTIIPPSASPVAVQSVKTAPLVVLSQTDPRWDRAHMGRATVGAKGCLIMNLVQMGLDQGFGSDPSVMLEKILTSGLIRPNGDVQTSMIDLIFPGIHILERLPVRSDSDLSETIAEKLAEGTVLLKLAHGRGFHWIHVVSVDEHGEIVITDPAGGRSGILTALYREASVREFMVIGQQ